MPADGAEGEIDRAEDEAEDGGHLEGEAGNHDVGARLGTLLVVRGDRGHAAAEGLEDEGDDVAGDEDSRIILGRQPRVFATECCDNPSQTQVDTRSHERRSNCKTTNLHQEAILAPGVLPAHDAAGVAEHLADEAQDECDIESRADSSDGPCDDISDEREGEDGQKGSIGSEIEPVFIIGPDVVAEG